jgi:hypothetical protein
MKNNFWHPAGTRHKSYMQSKFPIVMVLTMIFKKVDVMALHMPHHRLRGLESGLRLEME